MSLFLFAQIRLEILNEAFFPFLLFIETNGKEEEIN